MKVIKVHDLPPSVNGFDNRLLPDVNLRELNQICNNSIEYSGLYVLNIFLIFMPGVGD